MLYALKFRDIVTDNFIIKLFINLGIESNTKVVIETVNTENGTGKLKHIFHILFGIQNTEETTDFDVNDRKTFVKESTVIKRILNTSTIILMGIVVFLIGVYH